MRSPHATLAITAPPAATVHQFNADIARRRGACRLPGVTQHPAALFTREAKDTFNLVDQNLDLVAEAPRAVGADVGEVLAEQSQVETSEGAFQR